MRASIFMSAAMNQARIAASVGESPVGAVLVCGDQIIVAAHNNVESMQDPTAHAEILTIKAGTHVIHSKYLTDCELYVTLEPCPMCAYAISLAKIKRLYFGAYDDRCGAISSNKLLTPCYRADWYGGIEEKECGRLLSSFFAERRAGGKGR